MVVSSSALPPSGSRRLSSVPWIHDGCHGLDVQACEDVPTFDEGMIRRALMRGSLDCQKVDGLSQAINGQLWTIGYAATLHEDSVDRLVVVEVSKARR